MSQEHTGGGGEVERDEAVVISVIDSEYNPNDEEADSMF